jgi:hypothetical protein
MDGRGRERSTSLRRLLSATAGVAVLAIGASSAEAAPLHASFDEALVSASGQTIPALQPPNQAVLQGADVTAGVVTIPSPSGFFLGSSTFSFAPIGTSPIIGTLGAGGELSLQPHAYRATISLFGPACTYQADLAFSTANPSGGPFNGDPFTIGPPDTTLTQGVLETHWSGLPPDPQPGCGLINQYAGGPGGLYLANRAQPTGRRAAALKKCRKIKSKKKRRKCKRRARRLPL